MARVDFPLGLVIAHDKSLIGICRGYFGNPYLLVGPNATRPSQAQEFFRHPDPISSGVSIPTIKRLEAHWRRAWRPPVTGEKIVAALEKAGVEFLDDGQGVRLKSPKAKGKRK
jgi:hypothetical protein